MPSPSLSRQLAGLLVILVVTFTAATIGAAGSLQARGFYESLVRPHWAPPGWLFGPVWTTLYTGMAIAAWLVWRAREWSATRPALALFVAQLVLNAAWSWIFFVWRSGLWALVDILALAALLLLTIRAFNRVHRAATWLLLPYLAWVAFATALCFAVWQLNPVALGAN